MSFLNQICQAAARLEFGRRYRLSSLARLDFVPPLAINDSGRIVLQMMDFGFSVREFYRWTTCR
ncbi:hypothetical protein MPL1032_100122 [Mesorhizobium plurifarium]|uniref:Uncharacterized protein n=1 Tax=Mesorhizobium plurifarium TaxID=69974 RepID=A0A0K2VNB4_MESPL|nr:hypothetical protein MPL1032_100122 [Mesorhizobium plurifarium]